MNGSVTNAAGRSRRVQLVPSRADLVDAAFVLVLGVIALSGFRSTFDGWQFLLVGTAGLVFGLLAGHVAVALRAPSITVAVMALGAFFLLGGAVALRSDALAGVIPTPTTWGALADLGVHGWKQLMTTLPPVDGSGPLITIPYIIGLIAGAGSYTLARRVARAWPPVLALVVVLAAVVLLGTTRPADELVQGALFAVVALGWVGTRNARRRPVVGRGGRRTTRAATVVVLLALAGGAALLVGPALPGGATPRQVLRSHVTPPFDIGQYPSPLAGFRRYGENIKQDYDQQLFTVRGLPSGQLVRIATLDGYDGSVWGATNGTGGVTGDPSDTFQRVGTRLDTGVPGRQVSYTVTIADAYARAAETRAWVPTAGSVSSVEFEGRDADTLAEGFRFNLATDSGVTSALLAAGDTVRLRSVLTPSAWTASDVAVGSPTVPSGTDAFTSTGITRLAGTSTATGLAKLRVIAARMRETGAYSDGGREGEQMYTPGHSTYRLLAFLNRSQLVGTDEHYAATFALMANALGVPARVVLGAEPEDDGTVKGRDVHAWVEVRIGTGEWATVRWDDFTPKTSQHPKPPVPPKAQNANAAVVPPPTITKPLSSLEEAAALAANSQRINRKRGAPDEGGGLPTWLTAAVTYGGPPVLAIVVIVGGIVGAKTVRRRRRRGRRVLADRYGAGWRELLDTFRDLGIAAPPGQTRREQAAVLARADAQRIAREADHGVFGAADPTEASTSAFWTDVDRARTEALRGVSRWRRIRATLNVRSFLPQRAAAS